MKFFAESRIAVGRLKKFLLQTEATVMKVSSSNRVTIKKGSFKWNQSEIINLSCLNFKPPAEKLTAVIGEIGSGKSNLLCAILGYFI